MTHTRQMVDLHRRRFEHHGHGGADQAIVGLGGQAFMRPNSQDAVREFRPYFDVAPVYGQLEQLEILGGEVVPALRPEMAAGHPAHVPDAPTHENRRSQHENRRSQATADRDVLGEPPADRQP